MIQFPIHHHDMESHILCDKTGRSQIELQDDLDSEYVIDALNNYNRVRSQNAALVKALNDLFERTDMTKTNKLAMEKAAELIRLAIADEAEGHI